MWDFERGPGPVVASAIHHGHEVRPEVKGRMALGEGDRLREEDPFTGRWVGIGDSRIVVHRSRFEMDLNRPREKAVYLEPEDAWGLRIWRSAPEKDWVERSLAQYDAFYEELKAHLSALAADHGRFLLLDLHSYNHRRGGPQAPPEDSAGHPQINVGTGTLDRARWGRLAERFISDLSKAVYDGKNLDVRENVLFRGGFLSRWVHETFPASGCALAVEVKKTYMDEWSGEPFEPRIREIGEALVSALPGARELLKR